jgi:hypothetical protein
MTSERPLNTCRNWNGFANNTAAERMAASHDPPIEQAAGDAARPRTRHHFPWSADSDVTARQGVRLGLCPRTGHGRVREDRGVSLACSPRDSPISRRACLRSRSDRWRRPLSAIQRPRCLEIDALFGGIVSSADRTIIPDVERVGYKAAGPDRQRARCDAHHPNEVAALIAKAAGVVT